MSAEAEQAKWAVVIQAREFPCLLWEDDERARWSAIDVGLAVRGFSVEINAPDEVVRCRAVSALGWLGDPRGVSPLLRALHDRAVWVRRGAALALADFRVLPEWSVAPLRFAFVDEDVAVRAAAAKALGRCRSGAALAAVAVALDDDSSAVRACAVRAARELELLGYGD